MSNLLTGVKQAQEDATFDFLKKIGGSDGLEQVPFPKQTVDFVDTLLQVANRNNSQGHIRWEKDWETIKFIYQGFSILYPKSHADFEAKMSKWRDQVRNAGIAKQTGGGMVQHRLEVPRPLFDMIRTIFPDQKWDKPFIDKLSKALPQLSPFKQGSHEKTYL